MAKGDHDSVFKVKYNLNGGIYTLKAKNQENFKNKEKEIDYLREKEILYDLTKKNCPYTPKLYVDFQDISYRYLVLEYIEGSNLKNLRDNNENKGYIDQNLVIHILTQLLEALKYLHDTCKIMHRNIKPEEILLDKNNNIKLLGFGLAAYLDHPNKQLVSNKSFKGSIHYAPPEILFHPQPLNYDCKVDVFSLGFTIYSLMNPSQGIRTNLPKVTERKDGNIRRNDNELINKFYDKWLIEFVQLLYENDPKKRPNSKNALGLFKQLQNNPNAMAMYNQISSKNYMSSQNIIYNKSIRHYIIIIKKI